MARELVSAFRGGAILGLGNVFARGINFLLVFLYTSFFSPSEYGTLGYYLLLVPLIAAIISLGVDAALKRYYFELDRQQFFGAVTKSVILISIVFMLIGAIAFVFEAAIGFAKFSYAHIALMLLLAYLHLAIQLVLAYFTVTRQFLRCVKVSLFQALLVGGSIYITLSYIVVDIEAVLFAHLSVNAFLVFVFLFRFVPLANFSFPSKDLKQLIVYGAPLVFHTVGMYLLVVSDRIVLEAIATPKELGIYIFGIQLAMVLNIVVIASNRAWVPNYYALMTRDIADSEKMYQADRFLSLWVLIVGFIALGLVFIGPFLVDLVADPRYLDVGQILPLLVSAVFFQGIYHVGNASLGYFKKTMRIPIITAFALIINVLVTIMLYRIFGLFGAGLALLISFCFQSLCTIYLANQLFPMGIKLKLIIVQVLFVVAAVVASLEERFLLSIVWFMTFSLLLAFLFKSYWFNHNDLSVS